MIIEQNVRLANEIKSANDKFSQAAESCGPENDSLFCPEGTCEIDINLCLKQNDYILEVRDNGVGLPEDFDFRYSETTGMQLVNALVRQLDGLIDLENSHGTGFKITFRDFKI
jgi:signal transduction histidine kinase